MELGPIFIGGLDRSGKTLLRLMLSSHPNIAMSRRTYMWTRFYNRFGDLAYPENFERCLAAMLRHKPMRFLQPDPERIRREFGQGQPTYGRLFALFYQHYAEQIGKPRWGDQLGLIERYADPVFAAYPNAKMIHMIRDPRQRYEASVTPTQHRRGKVGRDTARWLYSVGLANQNQRRYPAGYKIVRYETLTAQPEETLRQICAFIGENFTPGMLTLENALRFEHEDEGEAGDDALERDAPYLAAGPVMSRRERAFMQIYARHDMLAHSYPLEPIQFSWSERLLFYLVDWPANRAGMLAWRTQES